MKKNKNLSIINISIYIFLIISGYYLGTYFNDRLWMKECIKNDVAYYVPDINGNNIFKFKDIWVELRNDRLIFSKKADSIFSKRYDELNKRNLIPKNNLNGI